MTNRLDANDQNIEECFLKLIDINREIEDRKDFGRKTLEYIIKQLFDSNDGVNNFNLLKDNDPDLMHFRSLSFKAKVVTIWKINKFSKSFVESSAFIHNECSFNGVHADNLAISQTGEPAYVDVIILALRPIVEWYLYDYRKFKKSDFKIDQELNKYYQNHFSFLDKRNSPYLKYSALFFCITTLGLLLYTYSKFLGQETEPQKQELVLDKKDTVTRLPSNTMTVGDSSSNNQQNIGSTVINGGSVFNVEKGNVFNTSKGDIHVKK